MKKKLGGGGGAKDLPGPNRVNTCFLILKVRKLSLLQSVLAQHGKHLQEGGAGFPQEVD